MRSRSARGWQFVLLATCMSAAATAFVTGVGARSTPPAPSTRIGRRVGEVSTAVKLEAFQGYLATTESMTMIISFEPRDQAGLQKLIADLYSPSSPNYRNWLTPAEFGERFGRTPEEFNHALDWLQGQGFVIESAFANRLDISFSGTVDSVQRAFNVQMGRYWDSVNSRSFFSNMQLPTLPPELDAITEGLEGLSNATLYHTHTRAFPGPYTQQPAGTPSPSNRARPSGLPGDPDFMAPADLAVAYDFAPLNAGGIQGQGQKIGIIIDSDVKNKDVTLYRTLFGLPPADIVRTVPRGLFSPGVQSSGQLEATLDVASVSIPAPMAEIDIVLIPELSFADTRMAEQFVVNQDELHVVNESFGACEQDGFALAEQSTYNQALVEGIAFFVATGDEGAECGNNFPGVRQIECPACYGGVTAVGGTQIQATFNQTTGALISVQSEDVWNSPPGDLLNCAGTEATFPAGATGGGISQIVDIPTYQALAQGFPNCAPPSSNRIVPDISALAGEPFTVAYLNGKVFFFIGTSEASPMWAGMITLVNQLNGTPIGSPNPLLYRLAITQYATASLPGSFHDITVGNNTVLPRQPC
ncbi:MAG TPA: S53 family peptidase, partial [Blastocatellia bacterium]